MLGFLRSSIISYLDLSSCCLLGTVGYCHEDNSANNDWYFRNNAIFWPWYQKQQQSKHVWNQEDERYWTISLAGIVPFVLSYQSCRQKGPSLPWAHCYPEFIYCTLYMLHIILYYTHKRLKHLSAWSGQRSNVEFVLRFTAMCYVGREQKLIMEQAVQLLILLVQSSPFQCQFLLDSWLKKKHLCHFPEMLRI